jgi:hypothetical protein
MIYASITKIYPTKPIIPALSYILEYTAVKPKIINKVAINASDIIQLQFEFEIRIEKSTLILSIGKIVTYNIVQIVNNSEPIIIDIPPIF